MEYISLTVSLIAIIISLRVFWLTRVKKGIVKMTRPTIICFVPENGGDKPKVFMRMLLYSTSDMGQYIQNMYVRLQQGEYIQNFNIWAYKDGELIRGSGLFINKSGVSLYHHFLLPKDEINCKFLAGNYKLQVIAETVDGKLTKIFEVKLSLSKEHQDTMNNGKATYFDWVPNSQTYFSYSDSGPKNTAKESFVKMIDQNTM